MERITFETTVKLPTVEDFLKKYPRFSTLVNGHGKVLFDAIIKPEVFVEARVFADFGYPSVFAVADRCQEIISKSEDLSPTDSLTKQFIGSVICTLMEANGYSKSGSKKSVPHKFFSVGEVYKLKPISRLEAVQRGGSTSQASPELGSGSV